MSPKEIFTQLSLWIVNLYLKSYNFLSPFILYLHVWIWIRIQKAPEYGSNTDPGPQHYSVEETNPKISVIFYGAEKFTIIPVPHLAKYFSSDIIYF